MRKEFFYLMLVAMLVEYHAYAGSCSSEIKLDNNNEYIGCNTTVNGHSAFSNPKQLTRMGCETFCPSLAGVGSLKSNRFDFFTGLSLNPDTLSCTANEMKDPSGNYLGCKTVVDGHTNESNAKELTPLGCQTFCSSLRNLEKRLSPPGDGSPSGGAKAIPERGG